MLIQERLSELLRVCDFIAARNLSCATTGNFSIRIDGQSMKISSSGKDKSMLKEIDFVTCDLDGNLLAGQGKPSAEAPLHGMIYQLAEQANCVLHTHSVPLTVLSMLQDRAHSISFTGYEMQKTIQGFSSHEEQLDLMIFNNDQDMHRLASVVRTSWKETNRASGFIVRGHGLYCWGNQIADAKRHMEGLEFLIECELQRRRYL